MDVDVWGVDWKVKELVVVDCVALAFVPTVKACTLVAAKKRKEMQMRRKDFMVVLIVYIGIVCMQRFVSMCVLSWFVDLVTW